MQHVPCAHYIGKLQTDNYVLHREPNNHQEFSFVPPLLSFLISHNTLLTGLFIGRCLNFFVGPDHSTRLVLDALIHTIPNLITISGSRFRRSVAIQHKRERKRHDEKEVLRMGMTMGQMNSHYKLSRALGLKNWGSNLVLSFLDSSFELIWSKEGKILLTLSGHHWVTKLFSLENKNLLHAAP